MTIHEKNNLFKPYLLESSLRQDLTDENFKQILTLVRRHHLVIFRGFPALSRDDLLQFCKKNAGLVSWEFGEVMEMKVSKHAENYLFTEGDVPLHWDGAFHQEPRFLLFHCIDAPKPNTGGETLFVNTNMVWKSATASQRAFWSDLQLQFSTEKKAHYGGQITAKLVQKHPDTRQTILRFAEPVGEDYLNPVDVQVVGKHALESKTILTEMSQNMRQPHCCYVHQWQQGDYLIADNFSLLHGRNAFTKHTPRHLRRIQIL